MNLQELVSFVQANILVAENCNVLLALQELDGKPFLQVDLLASDFEAYDEILQNMVNWDVEYLEHFDERLNSTITNLKIDAKVNLFLSHE